jgi:hypothetical protein
VSHTRRSSWCSLRTLGPVRRLALLLRSGMRCSWCDVELDQGTAQIDHVVPRCAGGTDENSNLCASCPDCNAPVGRGRCQPRTVTRELAAVLAAPVDLAAGRALALAWYPWAAARLGVDRPPRSLADTPEARKKRAQRARWRAQGLGGTAFPYGENEGAT